MIVIRHNRIWEEVQDGHDIAFIRGYLRRLCGWRYYRGQCYVAGCGGLGCTALGAQTTFTDSGLRAMAGSEGSLEFRCIGIFR